MHSAPRIKTEGLPLVVIVGNPNVGKSVLFNGLTGAYVTVSNYPGTTVEVARGKGRLNGRDVEVMDTPGMYRLLPISEEEGVARDILLHERPDAVIHVVDAKNLDRMLPMTLQLIEAGLPVILDVNLMDEATRLGVQVDSAALEHRLGIPVVGSTLTQQQGLPELVEKTLTMLDNNPEERRGGGKNLQLVYPEEVAQAVARIASKLAGEYALSRQVIALLLLQGDTGLAKLVEDEEKQGYAEILALTEAGQLRCNQQVSYLTAQTQWEKARQILNPIWQHSTQRHTGFGEKLSEAMLRPLTGIPILMGVLFMLYELVGVLGAQTLVNFLEISVFDKYINVWVVELLNSYVPWGAASELIGGPYGIMTLGMRYAFAIILPLVGTFFLAFSIIEDSGYLPRLAMLVDKVFKRIGLNGRAVIPIVLGFGCGTMATIVTRTLETRRERILSTILLALAVPCSAQLGVMFGLLAGQPAILALWILIVLGVFLLIGYLAAQVLPGEQASFYVELPPLRLPTTKNIFMKTYTRMEWYFREVFPLFILASVLIWMGDLAGLFELSINGLLPLVRWLGLPDETTVAFIFGFFRRDYGAAGLYDLRELMTTTQLLVATTTMTLFIPCIAQFSVTIKERGWKTALGISAFIFPFAFLVGGLLFRALTFLEKIL